MIDHLDLPPERDLPEQVRATARDRLLAGMRDNPGRAGRTMVPLAIAAAVVALAAIAVGVTALGGVGAHVSAASQYLNIEPFRQLPPEDTDLAYRVRHGTAPADLAARCLAQAHRDPAGRPAPEQWQVLLTATNHDDSVIAYHTSAGAVFCEVTPTTVALSQPGAPATSTARPTFITSFGTVAGTIDSGYRAAWITQRLLGQPLPYSQSAVVEDGVFLLPDAVPLLDNGLELGVASTLAAADMQTFTVARSQLPAVVQPTTDNGGALPPADQHTAAGQRLTACFHGPNSIPVVAPRAWVPGAYLKLDDNESVQLAGLGAGFDQLLAICTQRTGEPIDLEIFDPNGYQSVNTVDPNQLITATTVFYNFHTDEQGVLGSDQTSIVGQVRAPDIASVRMTWPGGPNLTAAVHAGTYVLPGYDLNDPSLRGGRPTITAYDAHGKALGSFPVRQ